MYRMVYEEYEEYEQELTEVSFDAAQAIALSFITDRNASGWGGEKKYRLCRVEPIYIDEYWA
jgi:hypothetical protein